MTAGSRSYQHGRAFNESAHTTRPSC
jgi:hypothetical protein